MKLYHFINEKYGLEAISRQRLKASTLDNLNDPFELFSIDLSSSQMFRDALRRYKSYLADKSCLLCFSKTWSSPLLWSHYADRHRGMALVFEVPDADVEHIKYRRRRIKIEDARVANEDTTKRLLTTKYIDWQYENEARLFKPVKDLTYEERLPFVHFDKNLVLTSIILGPLSKLSDSELESVLPLNIQLKVIRSRMAFRTFKIVRNKSEPVCKLGRAEQGAAVDGSLQGRN